jgi:hypothetical protein
MHHMYRVSMSRIRARHWLATQVLRAQRNIAESTAVDRDHTPILYMLCLPLKITYVVRKFRSGHENSFLDEQALSVIQNLCKF